MNESFASVAGKTAGVRMPAVTQGVSEGVPVRE